MKILELELKGYQRLKLRSINHIKIKPSASIQLILGSNGSGKSSILAELSPLPADHKQYEVGGFKSITISHESRIYTLMSDFTSGNKHSFLLGDEQLNPGGTISVQRDLVKQHFNITPEIHEFLCGEKLFTRMSPSERRKWFTMLCETNYDYALALFARVSQLHRDIAGSLRLAKARLVTESNKLISQSELKARQEEVKDIQSQLVVLIEQRMPQTISTEQASNELFGIFSRIEELSVRIIKSTIQIGELSGCNTIEQAIGNSESWLEKLNIQNAFYDGQIATLIRDKDNIQNTIDAVRQTGSQGVPELTQQLLQLESDYHDRKNRLKLDIVIDSPIQAKQSLEAIYEPLSSICNDMPSNEEETYTREALNALNEKIRTLKLNIDNLYRQQATTSAEISHMLSHKERGHLNCPKCDHSWTPGFEELVYQNKLTAKQEIEAQLQTLEAELKKTDTAKSKYDTYIAQYREVKSIVHTTPLLSPFWKSIEQENLIKRSPRTIITRLDGLRNDLELHISLENILVRQNELRRLITLAKQAGDTSLAELEQRSEKLNEQLFSIGQDQLVIKQQISTIKSESLKYRNLQRDKETLEQMMTESVFACDELVETTRREIFNRLIASLQSELATKETAVRQLMDQQNVIKDIEEQIAILSIKEKAAKLVVNELSPNDGLIAEGMIGFINLFIKQMNIFIRKVWLYPLIIQPCKLDEDSKVDLDYKFPVIVQSPLNTIPDVSKGSRSIEEIINLAFRLTAMQYLDLSTAPVILDEFSSSFDEAHRTSAMEVIKNIMEQSTFTQLFMVNHYETTYGALVNAQVMVICPENIALPKEMIFNQHVTIEKD